MMLYSGDLLVYSSQSRNIFKKKSYNPVTGIINLVGKTQ